MNPFEKDGKLVLTAKKIDPRYHFDQDKYDRQNAHRFAIDCKLTSHAIDLIIDLVQRNRLDAARDIFKLPKVRASYVYIDLYKRYRTHVPPDMEPVLDVLIAHLVEAGDCWELNKRPFPGREHVVCEGRYEREARLKREQQEEDAA